MAIKLITLAASLSVSKAQPEDEEEETPSHEFYLLMMIYTVLVILVTVAIQSLWNGGVGQVCEAFKRKIFNQGRSLPAEEDESQTEFPVPAGEGNVEERPSHVHPAAGASSRGEDGSGVEERPLAQLLLARQPGPGEDGSEVEERPLAQLPEAVHADEDGVEGHADPLCPALGCANTGCGPWTNGPSELIV